MSEKWKDKYLDLLDKIEDEPDKLEQLRRGLVEVSLTGQGVDAVLDKLLDSLRLAIRKSGGQNAEILSVLSKIEERQNDLEPQREAFASNSATALRILARPLIKAGINSRDIKTTLSGLDHKNFSMIQIPPLLEELAEYSKILEATKGADSTVVDPLKNLGNILKSRAQQLLDNLSVPSSMENEISKLKSELQLLGDSTDINQFLDLFSQFVIELLNAEQTSFRQYLKNLDDPLNVIEQLMHDNDIHLDQRDKLHENFDLSLNTGLASINTSLDNSKDIDTLKQQIKFRLDLLKQEFVDYNEERSTLENELISQYQSMKVQFTVLQKAQEHAVKEIQVYQEKSLTDSLTQLPNRAAWDNQLESEWQRFQRYGSALSLAIVDIDHFKKINDHHGHLAGDNVLRAVAIQLKKYLRNTDFLARYGGEEFGLLLPETNIEDAAIALDHVRQKVNNAQFKFKDQSVSVTISIGISQATKESSPDLLFSQADTAMYQAKKSGRNQIKISLEE